MPPQQKRINNIELDIIYEQESSKSDAIDGYEFTFREEEKLNNVKSIANKANEKKSKIKKTTPIKT